MIGDVHGHSDKLLLLPWLDLDGLRVVHACWDPEAIANLAGQVSETNALTDDLVVAASREETAEWKAIEHLLKGPELTVEPSYIDPGGHERDRARFRWWRPDAAEATPTSSTMVDPSSVR